MSQPFLDLLSKSIKNDGLAPIVEKDESSCPVQKIPPWKGPLTPYNESGKRASLADDDFCVSKPKRVKAIHSDSGFSFLHPNVSSKENEYKENVPDSSTREVSSSPSGPFQKLTIKFNRSQSESALSIKNAVERIGSDPMLIGDGSKSFLLPVLEKGKHDDLKEISPATLVSLFEGGFTGKVDSFEVIDCRYPYEYVGGHIKQAINLYTQKQILERFINTKKPIEMESCKPERQLLIFHCEFSSQRGPDLCRYLRSVDRTLNEFPSLHYPELYVLHGGYKAFFEKYKSYCDPEVYLPMAHRDFLDKCRFYKAESKTNTVSSKNIKPKSQLKFVRPTSMKKLDL